MKDLQMEEYKTNDHNPCRMEEEEWEFIQNRTRARRREGGRRRSLYRFVHARGAILNKVKESNLIIEEEQEEFVQNCTRARRDSNGGGGGGE